MNKWILKVKRNVDGFIKIFNVHLVIKKFTQEEIDDEYTFSIVKLIFVYLMLAIVFHMDLDYIKWIKKRSLMDNQRNRFIWNN